MLWYLANTARTALVWQQFDYGGEIQPAQTTGDDPDPSVWMHVQVRFSDTISQDAADDQVFTLDVINYTGDLVDPSWNDTDFQQVSTAIDNFVIEFQTYAANRYTHSETRFYARAFNPYSNPKPFTVAGGPAYVAARNVAMTGNPNVPPQCTTTITELTASRKHWGRFYLPTLGSYPMPAGNPNFAVSGRLEQTVVTDLANAAAALAAELASNNFRLVVPTTSSGGTFHPEMEGDWSTVPARTLQHVTGFRVDDVADVVRRRRHKNVSFRASV